MVCPHPRLFLQTFSFKSLRMQLISFGFATPKLWQSSNSHRNSRRISLAEVDQTSNNADNWCVLDQIVHLPPDPCRGWGTSQLQDLGEQE